ncbi:MAG: double-strand break repair protein AddB, partial [Alphaproteobacteria bacterium]
MFEPSRSPRVFALAPGVDFPRAVVQGLRTRFEGRPAEDLARVTVLVNTRRMQRRMAELFDEGPGLLMPKIRLVTDLALDPTFADIPPAVSPLRRRLEIAQIVGRLLETQPDLAPRSAIFSLADSLAGLLDEMQGEGVSLEALENFDVSSHSAHWQRSLAFIRALEAYFSGDSPELPGTEARQHQVVERLTAQWRERPPRDPIIIAGSTGSRGATRMLMEAVSRLPQGAVILPGFDFDMPPEAWEQLAESPFAEDHPQYRFARLFAELGADPGITRPWTDAPPPSPRRNALVSLALRPAPMTDQWQSEGPKFEKVSEALRDVTLIEAESPRLEATAIALVLREAAEQGVSAALVTPDRVLARRVTAALDRWHLVPDDSAGQPLPLSPPGRLLRHVSEMSGRPVTAAALLALLKHPLTNSGGESRGEHLLHTRDLELGALRENMPFPDRAGLLAWASDNADRQAWAEWVAKIVEQLDIPQTGTLSEHLERIVALASQVVAGHTTGSAAPLWEKSAGQEALRIVEAIRRDAPHGGKITLSDFRDLFASVLNTGVVRNPVGTHPGIRIWGTLEARVQGVELVVLG